MKLKRFLSEINLPCLLGFGLALITAAKSVSYYSCIRHYHAYAGVSSEVYSPCFIYSDKLAGDIFELFLAIIFSTDFGRGLVGMRDVSRYWLSETACSMSSNLSIKRGSTS
ncbi:hypothetical protein BJX70DRAFT_93243 [Aspergillus crustosus]